MIFMHILLWPHPMVGVTFIYFLVNFKFTLLTNLQIMIRIKLVGFLF